MFVLQHAGAAYEIATLQVLGTPVSFPTDWWCTVGPGPFADIFFGEPTFMAASDGIPHHVNGVSWGQGGVLFSGNPKSGLYCPVGSTIYPNDSTFVILAASSTLVAGNMPVTTIAFGSGTVSVVDLTAKVRFG